jgi:hypothetical protein
MRDYIQRMPKDADLLIRRAKETANLVSTEDIFWNENEQANDPANVERPFAEHTITPANMKTFLRASFLEDYFSGAPLKPWQASILVRDIIDTIQKFGNLKPEVFAERAKWVERYTGLYGNEKTYQELANSAGLSTDGVIRKAITKMSSDFLSKVTDSEKTRLYNKASVAPRPDNLVVPT